MRVALTVFAAALLTACGSSRKLAVKNTDHEPFNSLTAKAIKHKYAEQWHLNPGNIHDVRLYQFVDVWLGTPYRLGGNDRGGLDCSGLTTLYYKDVLQRKIPRVSAQQYEAATLRPQGESPVEGDLLFFNSPGSKRISHVGIYLQQDYFIHSASRGGVKISSLQEAYWKQCFVGCGVIP